MNVETVSFFSTGSFGQPGLDFAITSDGKNSGKAASRSPNTAAIVFRDFCHLVRPLRELFFLDFRGDEEYVELLAQFLEVLYAPAMEPDTPASVIFSRFSASFTPVIVERRLPARPWYPMKCLRLKSLQNGRRKGRFETKKPQEFHKLLRSSKFKMVHPEGFEPPTF